MNQDSYNYNSLGFDQPQPPQSPVIHQPPQELSIQEMEDLKQQYLDKLKRLSNLEYRDEIKIAALTENFNGMSIEICKKEKLLQQEQWAYLSTHPSKRLHSFCFDDDDEDYTSAITPNEPVLSTEEPDNSLSMRDEHLDTIPTTESDEFIKSSVENLIPIPSESEGIPENVCDVPFHDNSPPLDASPPDSELVSSEVMEIVIPQISTGGTTTPPDISLLEYEAFHDDHVKEISSGSPTTHSDSSLCASFIFDLLISPFPPSDGSDSYEFTDGLIPFISAPRNKDAIFDPGICNSHFSRLDISHRCGTLKKFSTHRSHLNKCPMLIHGQNNPPLDLNNTLAKITDQMTSITSLCEMACQVVQKKPEEERAAKAKYWKLLVCYDDDNDDERSDSLDDNIFSGLPPFSAITPDEPVLSTEEPDNSLSMGDEHLDTISATESDKFIKSGVENLIPIPSESEGIPDHMCDVPFLDNSPPIGVSKDQFEDFSESNEEFSSTDDESFSFEKIDYVEASPPYSELVSSEVMEIVTPEVRRIKASNDNPIPFYDLIISGTPLNLTPSGETFLNDDRSSDFKTKSSSTSLNSLLEETNNLNNSLPEFTTFSKVLFDAEYESNSSDDQLCSDEDVLEKIETDLFCTPDYPMPPGIEDKDYDSERDILISKDLPSNNTLSFAEKESFHFDIPLFSCPPAKPPDGDTGILNIKMMVKENQEKDKIGSKRDKNGKRGEARKSQKEKWGLLRVIKGDEPEHSRSSF
uniref:Uncharacterized protein n=1 Tax=Tanacetum cinerariifolium TaxID=118510 RepID=A0A6L2JWB7_TANCI|nr:hypothetical protein [Tanacetum cinerariifolium]